MTKAINIVAFAGATRKGSFNKKLAKVAAAEAEKAGATVTYIDLADYQMPLYDGDLEADAGIPQAAQELKKVLLAADGFLIASPEYNSSISAVLKNAIDWASRSNDGKGTDLSPFKGKYASIMAASPGALGGLRGLYHLRELLQNIFVTVMPTMQAVGQSMSAFNDDGSLKEEKNAVAIKALVNELVDTLKKVKAA